MSSTAFDVHRLLLNRRWVLLQGESHVVREGQTGAAITNCGKFVTSEVTTTHGDSVCEKCAASLIPKVISGRGSRVPSVLTKGRRYPHRPTVGRQYRQD